MKPQPREIIEADLAHALKTGTTPIIHFYIPKEYNWKAIRNHGADGGQGEFITGAMREVAKLNPDLQGVLDIKDYNERQSGQRTLDDDPLASLIEILSRHRVGLKNTEPDVLGRADVAYWIPLIQNWPAIIGPPHKVILVGLSRRKLAGSHTLCKSDPGFSAGRKCPVFT